MYKKLYIYKNFISKIIGFYNYFYFFFMYIITITINNCVLNNWYLIINGIFKL